MATKPIILYDLPTKKPEYGCWSPNVWKTRLVLNYKKLPYTTHFLKHHELAPYLSSIGLPPNQPNPNPNAPPVSPYTVPAIQLPEGTPCMDSALIAPKLEELYPTPSLHLEKGLHNKVLPFLGPVSAPLLAVFFPRIGRDVLLDETYPEWKKAKEAKMGMTTEELEKTKGGEVAWKAAEPGIRALSAFLAANKEDEGPFLLGSKVSYGDFILAALMEGMRRIGDDIFEKLVSYDENFRKLHDACAKEGWFEKDD